MAQCGGNDLEQGKEMGCASIVDGEWIEEESDEYEDEDADGDHWDPCDLCTHDLCTHAHGNT